MKIPTLSFTCLPFILFFLLGSCIEKDARELRNIDLDWKFFQGDIESSYQEDCNDNDWRVIDLPHDWSIEGEYSKDHGTDYESGYLPVGIGWYRKKIEWESGWENKKVFICFDGIYQNSQVWINGKHLGYRPNGYISFQYDISPFLHKGQNIIAVRVDHSKPKSGRWYTGSGIYRHVWLSIHNKVYMPDDEIFFRIYNLNDDSVNYSVETYVKNEGEIQDNYTLETSFVTKEGRVVESVSSDFSLAVGESKQLIQNGTIKYPALWSPDMPNYYYLNSKVKLKNKIIDQRSDIVGLREINVSAENGMKLNGEAIKLKGVCDHHTAGPVGSAIPDDVMYRRLKLLKDMGCNAIRTAHNPYSPTFYNMCDTIGFMVLNEAFDGWDDVKAEDDYGLYFNEWWETDLKSFIKRDRNHPSVIFWSLGNEVWNGIKETQANLIKEIRYLDPTRLITQGGIDPTRGMNEESADEFLLDIKGFNGKGEEINAFEEFHKKYPDIPIMGTEVPHSYQTRGVYRTKTHYRMRDFPAPWEARGKKGGTLDGIENKIFKIKDLTDEEVFKNEKCEFYYFQGQYLPIENKQPWSPNLYYQSSYDNATVRISVRKQWQRVESMDYVMGQFRWGSFDYLGESNLWPSRMANFGIIDVCGFPKDHYYLYQSLWSDNPMVHMLPHWTHPGLEGVEIPVVVYTNCESAELFLNDESLGRQKYLGEQLVWDVPYKKGELMIRAYISEKEVARQIYRSADAPGRIQLLPDRKYVNANRKDVIHIEVNITDSSGTLVPYANNLIEFNIDGPARLIGVDNGDPLDLSRYKIPQRRAFRGKCLLMLQSLDYKGDIKIEALSDGLKPQILIIKAR